MWTFKREVGGSVKDGRADVQGKGFLSRGKCECKLKPIADSLLSVASRSQGKSSRYLAEGLIWSWGGESQRDSWNCQDTRTSQIPMHISLSMSPLYKVDFILGLHLKHATVFFLTSWKKS